MQYPQIEMATFIDRPNRFIAHVRMEDGRVETVHVKNTGRCKELLIPDAQVVLAKSDNPQRKTAYDLVAVYKAQRLGGEGSSGDGKGKPGEQPGWLFNIDSQAPNQVVAEWLAAQDFDLVRPEYTYGNSRVDFYMERCSTGGVSNGAANDANGADSTLERHLMEVKGCTLEREGIGYFPDAPTERGVKHLQELAQAAQEGYHCTLAFVIPMEGVYEVRPNDETHPAFGQALAQAREAGVKVLFLPCSVAPDELRILRAIEE